MLETMRTPAKAAELSLFGIGDYLRSAKAALRSPNGKRAMAILRFALSLISVIYLFGIVKLAYYSAFYELVIPEEMQKAFCWRVSSICLLFTILLLYTRKQFVTKLSIMLSMPFHLFIFLFNYRYLVLIIPMSIMILLTYFGSGVKEGPKTIFGAIYVMIYIIGVYAYMAAGTLLTTTSVETVVESGVSAMGTYRYEVVQVDDHADGSTYLTIEPNTNDMLLSDCKLMIKGYEKRVFVKRPLTEFQTAWTTEKRSDITEKILRLNRDASFTLTGEQVEMLGITDTFHAEYTVGSLSMFQRRKLGVCIEKDLIGEQTPESEGLTLHEKDDVLNLSFAQIQDAGLNIEYEVKLAELTDADLAALGIPEQCDVLSVNGKTVFREYIAVLENTYVYSEFDFGRFFD